MAKVFDSRSSFPSPRFSSKTVDMNFWWFLRQVVGNGKKSGMQTMAIDFPVVQTSW